VVVGDLQTEIKNLGRVYRNIQIVSGATILGNGTVALILDPQRLVQNAIREVSGKDGFSNGCAHAQINSTSRKEQRNDVT